MPLTREQIDQLKGELQCKPSSENRYGGQVVGTARGVTISHPDFGFKLELYEFRTQAENFKIARELFEYFLISLP